MADLEIKVTLAELHIQRKEKNPFFVDLTGLYAVNRIDVYIITDTP